MIQPRQPRAKVWQLRTQTLQFDAGPAIMGIVNVTPDSFSDGGRFHSTSAAVDHAMRLEDAGAHIIDVGGESTRPYSLSVQTQDEIRRVIPVIEQLAARVAIPISIDTSKAAVADAAIQLGAQIVNDVTGLEGDPGMLELVAKAQVGVCAMHMQGTPQTMQDNPTYADVVSDIFQYLQQRYCHLLDNHVQPQRICLDPGIGFGKTFKHNLELLQATERFLELGCPILIGHSRKGFIGKLLGSSQSTRDADKLGTRSTGAAAKSVDSGPSRQAATHLSGPAVQAANPLETAKLDAATLGVTLAMAAKGVQVIRVHEVANTVAALTCYRACNSNH